MKTGTAVLQGQVTRKSLKVMSFKEALAYKNEGVVAKYQKEFNLSREDAQTLFDDVKRFLWLYASTGKAISPSQKLDEGWHTFIIFTQSYQEFCLKYLGRFIHHVPNVAPGLSAVGFAKKAFGKLSANWGTADCEAADCAPVPSCSPAEDPTRA